MAVATVFRRQGNAIVIMITADPAAVLAKAVKPQLSDTICASLAQSSHFGTFLAGGIATGLSCVRSHREKEEVCIGVLILFYDCFTNLLGLHRLR